MCGIYGQIAKSAELNVDHQIQACNSISCRGPDSQGLVLGNSINQKINYIQLLILILLIIIIILIIIMIMIMIYWN